MVKRVLPKLWAVYGNDGEWRFIGVGLARSKDQAIKEIGGNAIEDKPFVDWKAFEMNCPKLYSQTYGRLKQLENA